MLSRIIIPTAVPNDIKNTVLEHVANTEGGYTLLEGSGGWLPDGGTDTIEEPVQVLEVDGMPAHKARDIASWIQVHTDESAVLWQSVPVMSGMATDGPPEPINNPLNSEGPQ